MIYEFIIKTCAINHHHTTTVPILNKHYEGDIFMGRVNHKKSREYYHRFDKMNKRIKLLIHVPCSSEEWIWDSCRRERKEMEC